MYLQYLSYIFVFVLGLIIGSFLNVYILRLHTGKDTKGRSSCASCGKALVWYELVPIVSFIFLKGRCSKCKTRISFQYPLVELSAAILFLLLWTYIDDTKLALLSFPLAALSVVIASYDIKHKIIPQELIYATFVNVLLLLLYKLYFYTQSGLLINTLQTILESELFFALPIFLLWFLTRGKAMGFGDVKLTFALAPLLGGFAKAWTALTLSFVSGAVLSLLYLAYSKIGSRSKLTLKSEVAFGPFILLAFWFVYLSGISFYDIINLL